MAVTRLSGLTSGLDVDSLVEKLMSAQQTRLDKLNQQQTKMTWKQEDYRSLTTSIVDFRNNKLSSYSLSGAIGAKTTAVTGNTTSVTATASSTATGSLAVTVNQLATAGSLQLSTGATDASTKLSATSMASKGSQSVEVNGVQIAYDSTDTISSLITKINSSSAGATAIFNAKTGVLAISSNTTGSSGVSVGGDLSAFSSNATGVALATGVPSASSGKTLAELKTAGVINYSDSAVTVNGVSIAFDESTDTISTLASKINASSAGAKATYNSTTGEFTINNTSSSASKVTLGGDLFTGSGGFEQDGVSAAGLDAKVNVNGLDMEYESNSFTVNGVTVALNSVSGTGGPSNITVKADTSTVLNTIKSFISDYNTMIGKVNSELSETVYRTYTPLTDTQKKSMTDDEIELWQSKARSGGLRNDATLSKLTSDLRLTSTASVQTSSGLVNLQSIGISTGKYTENGKLVIEDQDKLTKALTENPTMVTELLGLSSSDKSATSTTSGVFARMSNIANTALTSLYKSAGTSTTSTDTITGFASNSELSTQISAMDTKISDFKEFMTRLENSYYTKFTAMETAISKFNSQSTSLSSFSG